MEDCIFCKIVKGEIPSYKLFENEHVLAFLDIMPASEGHSLVIPKKHFENLMDVPEKELEETMKIVQKVAKAVMKATHAEGFNVIQSNYRAAGQVVPHLHFHIIPRNEDDGNHFHLNHGNLGKEQAEKTVKEIKVHLK